MLRAGLAVPAESGPEAVLATSYDSRREVYGATPTRTSARAPASGSLRCRPEHECFHGDQVVEHRLPRSGAIATCDRLDDAPVVLMRASGSTRGVDRLLAALREEIHDRVHEPRDRPVVSGRADRGVKGRVLREPGAPLGDL